MEERIIRINKVLRELNISLERAVDYLQSKGIYIESNPNTKINNETYLTLIKQFSGNDEKLNYSNGIEINVQNNIINSKVKPKLILGIEKKYNITLKGRKHQIFNRNEYLINDKDLIIGLSISDNKIANISTLKNFTDLKYLDLSHNNIADIEVLKGLSNLEILKINGNQIKDISILQTLTKLEEVNLVINNITNISPLFKLINLKKLDISSNFIDDLKQFQFIINLPLLELKIDNNPYFSFNNIILKSKENHYKIVINELKKVLDDLQISAVLPEKIILLGNHASGKSSFLYYLQNEKLDYSHDTTHVLKIENYPKQYDKLPQAIVYDFGGQDFYHGIYQTFLTSNCITILFWNTESNENIVLTSEDSKGRPNRNFNTDYWLGQRKHKGILGDLLLVQTKSDSELSVRKSYININEDIINEFYVSLQKENSIGITSKLKQATLQYLKESLNYLISCNQKQKNNDGKLSKPYYDFVRYIIETSKSYESVKKETLFENYIIDKIDIEERLERFEIDLEQLKRQGLILINNDDVWLNPVALTEYVHTVILQENIIGNGIIKESIFKSHKFDSKIIELLIKEKVIFYHRYGLNNENKIEKEYIIPNYLPQVIHSGIDYDLMTFGLDNPLFILKFKDYLPFGLINQLICYFGNLPDRKKFWREHLIFTIDKKVKILIELDFKNLKIKVFGVYNTVVDQNFKDDIEKYLFYIIMAMYWDIDILPKNFKEFKNQYKKYVLKNEEVNDTEDIIIIEDLYFDPDCRPADLFISKDDEIFVKYDALYAIEDNQTIIRTYCINDNFELIDNREMPISTYQNFTHQRLKKMKKVFISYSHDDLIYRKELQTYLVNLERENKIEIWHDGLIDAGSGWNEKIIEKLKESDIIIMLISQTFISSKYIHEVEMKKALEQKLHGQSKIIPILVSNCDWNNWNVFLTNNNEPFDEEEIEKGKINNYQFMPMNEGNQRLEALNRWKYPEDAWTKIIKKIRDYSSI